MHPVEVLAEPAAAVLVEEEEEVSAVAEAVSVVAEVASAAVHSTDALFEAPSIPMRSLKPIQDGLLMHPEDAQWHNKS